MRKINKLLRKNKRELERSLNQLQPLRKRTEALIKKSVKSKDLKSAKIFAKELIRINKQHDKIYTSKTKLESITMSINEQYSMNKLTDSMRSLTGIMKDVNQLVSLGVISGTMQELQKELMKAGIINEMVDDIIDVQSEDEELETESLEQVDKIIQSLTEDKVAKAITEKIPNNITTNDEELYNSTTENEDHEALNEMRERLKALEE